MVASERVTFKRPDHCDQDCNHDYLNCWPEFGIMRVTDYFPHYEQLVIALRDCFDVQRKHFSGKIRIPVMCPLDKTQELVSYLQSNGFYHHYGVTFHIDTRYTVTDIDQQISILFICRDKELQKGLSDRLYDKRKVAALELEQVIRQCVQDEDRDKIKAIIDELCRNFAYAVHSPNSRNGGLIGLAAAAIALGQNEVALYLEDIIHPVLACFGDQDARVRYYACESMYNIAKVSKGEILLYFNEIFDALCRLAGDSDPAVKNGADLLDRLIKDIVAEKATTYVSVIPKSSPPMPISSLEIENEDPNKPSLLQEPVQSETTFSLAKFIPVLMERVYVINPFARMFLVSWITLLDSIPDLELISYLPSFLGGLISFLSDPSEDVRVATHSALSGFLQEIRRITNIKKALALEREKKRKAMKELPDVRRGSNSISVGNSPSNDESIGGDQVIDSSVDDNKSVQSQPPLPTQPLPLQKQSQKQSVQLHPSDEGLPSNASLPLAPSSELQTQSESINPESSLTDANTPQNYSPNNRIDEFNTPDQDEDHEEDSDVDDEGLYIPGQDVYIDYVKIIEILISHLDSSEEDIQIMVLSWIETLLEVSPYSMLGYGPRFLSVLLPTMACDGHTLRQAAERVNDKMLQLILDFPQNPDDPGGALLDYENPTNSKLDYPATVNALTLHFLNEKEQTRVAALDWLIMLHRKVPRQILAINDGTFPALLKTLSDPSEQVITKDLQLLAQISYNSNDEYFAVFMVNLLNLFSTDRRLLESRGKLIIRQLCISLNPERIYRTMADILERDDDVEFASLMVLNLNNNLITAPELADLRTRLRSLDTRDGASFFVVLFKSWCHNSAAALSLCLLAQAYEHAFQVLQIIVEFEVTVGLLVQMDKLVQLLESPIFTQLRLQLLEPEKYPFLYKILYGILMILPQSSAFNTLKNRLNSVSAIGYVHIPQPRSLSTVSVGTTNSSSVPSKASLKHNYRDDIKWTELLDKFRTVQKRLQAARNQTSTKSFRPHGITSPVLDESAGLNSKISGAYKPGIIRGNSDRNYSHGSNVSSSKGSASGSTSTIRRLATGRGPFGLRKQSDDKKK